MILGRRGGVALALRNYQQRVPNSGTYEIKGTMLTRRPLVNKASPPPGVQTFQDAVRELKFEGNNTMIQIVKSADGKSETRRTYTRLE
jgi:hypothetical protein